MKLITLTLILSFIFYDSIAQEIQNEGNIKRQSRLEIRIGASERFVANPIIPEYNTLIGFHPSIHLTLPIRIPEDQFILSKLIFGGTINNIEFNQNTNGIYRGGTTTTIYDNIYVGFGLGYAMNKKFSNGSFLRFPISLSGIYYPYVEISKEPGTQPVPGRDYEVEINSNYDEELNISIVPEIAMEYHFKNDFSRSFNIGVYYSRGFYTTYRGEIILQRANGERFSQSFSKPFNAFGISFGYGLYRKK